MVLAQAVEVDVLDDDHLAVIDGEQRAVEDVVDVRVVAAGQEFEGLFDPFRRVHEPFAGRIFPEFGQQLSNQIPACPIVEGMAATG